jgi:pyruvate kinase
MGPRESDDSILAELAKEMDVARFNFSHGTHESHLEMLTRVRKAAKEAGRPIAMLLDTKGPEIRTGLLEDHESVKLMKGGKVVISYAEDPAAEGNAEHIYVTYKDMAKDLSAGDTVLIDDGAIELKVESVDGDELKCSIINGGILSERKGVNLPGIKVGLPDLTEKDYEDIRFGLENDYDFIAASFVRNAGTINKIRKLAKEYGSRIKIIAKIESGEGIDNFEEIVDAADGVMVARGDLGVEVEAKMIPQLQREMIARCNEKGKIVITATQMLDSMMRNPRPTRAEVTDVANAVYDGSDAVMLSGETASGEYPVEALKMMVSIAEYTEIFARSPHILRNEGAPSVSTTTCMAAVKAAKELRARAILAPTSSGATVVQVSKCRPDSEIYAFSPEPMVVRQMNLLWGVRPMLSERAHTTDELMEDCLEIMREKGLSATGDILVFIAGVVSGRHSYQRSQTNTMKIIEL